MRYVRHVCLSLVCLMALASCAPAPTFLIPRSSIAAHQARLFEDFLIEAVIIFVIIMAALLWMLWRGYRSQRRGGIAPQTRGPLILGLAAALLVIAADGVDFGMMTTTMREIGIPLPASNDVHVRVIGHRWWWEFDYPDLGIKTANELHIPVGTNVQIELSSVDVIHSFWAPQLGGKRDAIPGQLNRTWIRADEPGTYWGQCSEFCGAEHAYMRLRVVAQSPQDFEAWSRGQLQPAAMPVTEQQTAGYKILTSTCATCHSLNPQEPRTNMVGPNLAHLYSRSVFAGATFDLNLPNLRSWVTNTQAMKPENDMHINLKPADIDAVLAYLQLLK